MGIAELAIADWGGVVIDAAADTEQVMGSASGSGVVPVGLRRRMPRFALAAVRCAVGVSAPGCELVFASRYGDVPTALNLSQAIVASDLLSPSAFSACVHNAAPGLAAQVLGEKSSHTALAAGADSLAAGVLEAWLRLRSAEAAQVVLLFTELPLPGLYDDFEHEPGLPGVALALRLTLAASGSVAAVDPGPGRAGALALLAGLQAGAKRISVRAPVRIAA
jgi:hypothetical protein